MRLSVTTALIKIALLSVSASCAFASDADMPGKNNTHCGFVSSTPASMPASLGLKPPCDDVVTPSQSDFDIRTAAAYSGYNLNQPRPILYSGVRATSRAGLQSAENFSGILYPLSERWLSSVEASMAQESLLASRRYSLSSQLHTTLSGGWGISLGLKRSVYGAESASLLSPNGTAASGVTNGYLLAPAQYSESAATTSFQLQLDYPYGQRNLFGIAYASGRNAYLYSPPHRPFHDTRQFMLTGQHWLTSSWALSYDVYAPESGSLLPRQGLKLGLRYRF